MAIYYADGSNSGDGRIVQVKSALKKDFSTIAVNINASYGSYADILSVNITPTDSSNNIMIWYTISGSGAQGSHGISVVKKTVSGSTSQPFLGNSTSGYNRATTGTRFIGSNNYNISNQSFMGLDSADTTSQITYTITGATEGATNWYINNNGMNAASHSWSANFCTSITAMEIVA